MDAAKQRPNDNPAITAGTAAAALVVGTQVASKVARDAIFLSTFPAAELAKVMLAAAGLSLLAALGAARLMSRLGPARVVPVALLFSGALFVAELAGAATFPETTALVIYLHVAALGGVLVSGFWSVVAERFDPHRARQTMGRLASGATLGGALGGLAADGAVRGLGVRGLLVVLTVASVAAALAVDRLGRARAGAKKKAPVEPSPSPWVVIKTPHLATLGALGVASAIWSSFFDFGLKVEVASALGSEGDLVTFFGWYYTATSVATFALQSLLGHRMLTRYGLTATVASLPAFVVVGGLVSSIFPLLATVTGVRGTEAVLSNSLYRSGYELFFTPLSASTKRAAKTVIDVVATRAGDGIGSGLVLAALAFWPHMPATVPIAAGSVVALASLALVPRLHRGYVGALEEALRAGVVDLPQVEASLDATTRRTLTDTTQSLDRERLLKEIEAYRTAHLVAPAFKGPDPKRTTARSPGAPPPVDIVEVAVEARDPRAAAAHALVSGDTERVRAALETGIEPALVRLGLPFLTNPKLATVAERALSAVAPNAVGAIEDAILDRREGRSIRARAAALLAGVTTARARDALLAGLDADAFDVRVACGRALAKLAQKAPELAPSKSAVSALVARAVETMADEARTLRKGLASIPPSDAALPLPGPITARLDPVVLHALTLLATVADPEALALAGRALAGTDAALRGTALEYLENVVESPARELLLARIGTGVRIPAPRRSEREIVEALYKSRSG